MGIDITCGTKSSGMSYTSWMFFRENLIMITMLYLKKEIDRIRNNKDINNSDESSSSEYYSNHYLDHYVELASKLCDNFIPIIENIRKIEKRNNEDNRENNETKELVSKLRHGAIFYGFLDKINSDMVYLDAMIYLGVGGLYSLCKKSDCDGFYSPGNSLDICNLFDLLKDDIKDYDALMYKCVYDTSDWSDTIYSVFEESWKSNTYILIH